MSVRAINDNYVGIAKDGVENFHGNQLVYVGWDHHLMFCAPICLPLPPDMPFQALIGEVLPGAYGLHPDFQNIEWDQVQWTLDQEPFTPDLEKGLADNGVGHKSVIRFDTPGLDGLSGSAS